MIVKISSLQRHSKETEELTIIMLASFHCQKEGVSAINKIIIVTLINTCNVLGIQ